MYEQGDRVRVDIPDPDDPEFKYNREAGTIDAVIEDAAGSETGDERDSNLYRVELDSGETMDFRWQDLRPMYQS
jgi:hypothetical protein